MATDHVDQVFAFDVPGVPAAEQAFGGEIRLAVQLNDAREPAGGRCRSPLTVGVGLSLPPLTQRSSGQQGSYRLANPSCGRDRPARLRKRDRLGPGVTRNRGVALQACKLIG